MPNIDVSADILEFLQAANYAAARPLLQDTAPYYGLIATKTNVDATVATTAVYGVFESGLTTANTIPTHMIIRYRSGTFAAPCEVVLVINGVLRGSALTMEYLNATTQIMLTLTAQSYFNQSSAADGWGTYLNAANGGAAAFDFEIYGIITP